MITVSFDGGRPGLGTPSAAFSTAEVLNSSVGQAADQIIERAAHRFRTYGEVPVLTDDQPERETVLSLGASACSCRNSVQLVGNALAELTGVIRTRNRRERHAFKRRKL